MSDGEHEQRARERARALVEDPSAADRVAGRAAARAERFRERLGEALDDVRTLTRLVRAWARREYRSVSMATILAALGALVYFLIPTDAIPDFIAALGLIDDVAVIGRVVHYIRGDLARFRQWEEQQSAPTGDEDGDSV